MTQVTLPAPLAALANTPRHLSLSVSSPVTVAAILTALEKQHPALLGTLRDQSTLKRRPLVRFFAAGNDISHDPLDKALPESIETGAEPLIIIGAIAGG